MDLAERIDSSPSMIGLRQLAGLEVDDPDVRKARRVLAELRSTRTDLDEKLARIDRRFAPEAVKAEAEKLRVTAAKKLPELRAHLDEIEQLVTAAEGQTLEGYLRRSRIDRASPETAARAMLLSRTSLDDLVALVQEAAGMSKDRSGGPKLQQQAGDLIAEIVGEVRFRADSNADVRTLNALRQIAGAVETAEIPEYAQRVLRVAELKTLHARITSTAKAIETGAEDVGAREEKLDELKRRRDAGEEVTDADWRAAMAIK